MDKRNQFNTVLIKTPGYNGFDLSFDHLTSCNMGELIPVMCKDVMPGSKHNLGTEGMIRLAPMIFPMMHSVKVYFHSWFVAYRNLWPGFEKWITNDDSDGPIPAFPTIAMNGNNYKPIDGYLGVPQPYGAPGNTQVISAMYRAAYACVYNFKYRAEKLQPEIDFELVDGDNTSNPDLWPLRKRCWQHDYFTSALPEPQAGPGVDLPLGTVQLASSETGSPGKIVDASDYDLPVGSAGGPNLQSQVLTGSLTVNDGVNPTTDVVYDPQGSLVVGATTINDLRAAEAAQKFLEAENRAGNRYDEHLAAHFGLRSLDARLQRPEYITGSVSPVRISEVLNNTGTEDAPQGAMAGHGIAYNNPDQDYYMVKEHGCIITLMSIMPDTVYQQGMPAQYLKTTDRYQYAFPEFAHLGEQPIKKSELLAYGPDPLGTFGYIPRYAEYTSSLNMVTGDFRNNGLNAWHMSRIFPTGGAEPGLNATFVESDPTHRVFAVTDPDVQKLYCHIRNHWHVAQQLPKYVIPSM